MLDNDIVNLCGPTFAGAAEAGAGCDTAGLVIAFEAARQSLRFDEDWARSRRSTARFPRRRSWRCSRSWSRVLRGQTYWFARRAARRRDVRGLIDRYQPAVDALRELVPGGAVAVRAQGRRPPLGGLDQARRAQDSRRTRSA